MPRDGKIYQVAIMLDTATSWSRSLVQGILKYTREHGPWHIHLEPQPDADNLRLPRHWRGDGIIARIATEKMGKQLDATGAQVVNISSIQIKNGHWPRVITSAESEARMAYETLRSRGFRQFAYVGDMRFNYVAALYRAFEKVLSGTDHSLHLAPSVDPENLEKWLRSLPRPVAIYSWGSSLGHLIIDLCLNAGIRVPHDIAVLGSSYDELLSEASYPPQAGIRMATEEIGFAASTVLNEMMQGRKPKRMRWEFDPLGVVERLSIDTLAVEDRRMADVMQFLKEHALEPISVPDVLKANPMARRSLERKFQQLFGCSIVEQIHRLRINHARVLLADTDDPVTLIAEKCCFCSHSYLNRTFKKSTGLSPGQYRAQFRKVGT